MIPIFLLLRNIWNGIKGKGEGGLWEGQREVLRPRFPQYVDESTSAMGVFFIDSKLRFGYFL